MTVTVEDFVETINQALRVKPATEKILQIKVTQTSAPVSHGDDESHVAVVYCILGMALFEDRTHKGYVAFENHHVPAPEQLSKQAMESLVYTLRQKGAPDAGFLSRSDMDLPLEQLMQEHPAIVAAQDTLMQKYGAGPARETLLPRNVFLLYAPTQAAGQA